MPGAGAAAAGPGRDRISRAGVGQVVLFGKSLRSAMPRDGTVCSRPRYRRSLKNSENLAAARPTRCPGMQLASYGGNARQCPDLGQETPRCSNALVPVAPTDQDCRWTLRAARRPECRFSRASHRDSAQGAANPAAPPRRARGGHRALPRTMHVAGGCLAARSPAPCNGQPREVFPAACASRPKRAYDARNGAARRAGTVAYTVKEIFKTLQGEGAQAGRAAVFCRFAGCNLWSGREEDRATPSASSATPILSAPTGRAAAASRARHALAQRHRASLGERASRGASSFSPAASRCCNSMTR